MPMQIAIEFDPRAAVQLYRIGQLFNAPSADRRNCRNSTYHSWVDERMQFIDQFQINEAAENLAPTLNQDIRHLPFAKFLKEPGQTFGPCRTVQRKYLTARGN